MRMKVSPAKRLALALTLACLVVSAAPAGLARAQAAPEVGVQPPHYNVQATYDPLTSRLTVRCDVEMQALTDLPSVEFFLPEGLTFVSPTGQPGDTRPTRPGLKAGEKATFSMDYQGTPKSYTPEDNRYWCWATPKAVWLTSPWVWLPQPCARFDMWAMDVTLRLTLPRAWVVFVPGNPDPQVETAPGSQSTTYVFETLPGGRAQPWAWFAGPYTSFGTGQVGDASYEVWGLPDWKPEAESLAAQVPDMLTFLLETLGELRSQHIVVLQIPPAQGGGVMMGGSGLGSVLVAVTPGTRPTSELGDTCVEQLRVHELIHAVANFYPDEGFTEFVCDLYVARRIPEMFAAAVTNRRTYVLRTFERYGDKPIDEATKTHLTTGELLEWHAYCYSKPALVWNMFRGIYGDEKTFELIRRLNQEAPAYNFGPGGRDLSGWWDFCAGIVGEVAGSEARAFYDHWFREAAPLDLAVADVRCRRPAPAAGQKGWSVTLTLKDEHAPGKPAGRDTVPWVEVAVAYEALNGGVETKVERVDLTGDSIRVEMTSPGRPLTVMVDPSNWLLDYDPTNNKAEVPVPLTLAETMREVAPPAAGVLVLGLAVWLARRRPKTVKAPEVGQAPQGGDITRR